MRQRWLSIALLILAAGPWSLALGVLGVWFIAEPHTGFFSSPWVSWSAGIVALCAGQLVFLNCVADRVFPSVHTRVRSVAQIGNVVILIGSAGVLLSVTLLSSV